MEVFFNQEGNLSSWSHGDRLSNQFIPQATIEFIHDAAYARLCSHDQFYECGSFANGALKQGISIIVQIKTFTNTIRSSEA